MLGFVITSTIMLGINVLAQGNWKKIDVIMNGIGIYMNKDMYSGANQPLESGLVLTDAQTILYNDTTYVPLRYISESFDIPVNYVEETNSVMLGSWDGTTPKPPYQPAIDDLSYLINNPNYMSDLVGFSISVKNESSNPYIYWYNKSPFTITGTIINIVLKNGTTISTASGLFNNIKSGSFIKNRMLDINNVNELEGAYVSSIGLNAYSNNGSEMDIIFDFGSDKYTIKQGDGQLVTIPRKEMANGKLFNAE